MAQGGSDFCLTSVSHYATARDRFGELPARFVAVVAQRSPMSALVAAESALHEPADLPGQRVGGHAGDPFVKEYAGALEHLGLGEAVVVPVDHAAAGAALGRGEIDAVPEFADLVPRIRKDAAIPVRAVPFGLEFYSSGLVAGDRLPDELVERVRAALVAALERQQRDPRHGLDALVDRYPNVDPEAAVEGWRLAEPNIFTGDEVGGMDDGRWSDTLAHVARVHGLDPLEPPTVYRPHLVSEHARPAGGGAL